MKRILTTIIIIIVLVTGLRSFYINPQDEQCIILTFGKYNYTEMESGLKWKWPWQKKISFPKRMQMFDSPVVETITGDKQNLCFDSVAIFRIVDPYKYYIKFPIKSDTINYINDIVYNAIRIQAGRYKFYELIYSQRDKILKEAVELTNKSSNEYGILIEDIMLKRVFFPSTNLESVYNNMIAERNQVSNTYRVEGKAEAIKIKSEADRYYNVEIAKARGEASRIVGNADAEAQKLIQSTMDNSAGLYELLKTYDVYNSSMKNVKILIKPDGYIFNELKGK